MVKKMPERLRDRIWLTTVGELRQHQHEDAPISAGVWLRGREVENPKTEGVARHTFFPNSSAVHMVAGVLRQIVPIISCMSI